MLSSAMTLQYLERLQIHRPKRPTTAALFALHRAHVEKVPYETLEIQLGRPTSIDPDESVDRILGGRGGYCYHLNGAFAALLSTVGYRVAWHLAGVQVGAESAAGANCNHLALTVECEGQTWFADVGLADALYTPLPLSEGMYSQGCMTFGLRLSEAKPGGWRFDHDSKGSFLGMDFQAEPASPADFVEQHQYLSTSPKSPFANTAFVFRRDFHGVDALRGCVLTRIDRDGRRKHELTTGEEWFAVLRSRFGLTLSDLSASERQGLWHRVHEAHVARESTMTHASYTAAAD
ncbi:arylamine N-acetyltransferase [Streptomyces sp. NPDC060064]|uniref:arylamine N-acetyltransferase family protein n=1 Tax=Streptomyces sp. NPDC060064 TaxID=3347049 RepID=UPI00367A9018